MATTIAAPRRSSASPTPAPRRAPVRRRPPLEVVPPPRRSRIGLIGVIGTVAIFGVLFVLVLFQTVMVQNQSRLDHLDANIRDQQARYQQLRLQVAQLEAPARVVEEATHRLGMVPPPGTSYLTPSATDAAASATSATSASGGPTSSDGLPDDSVTPGRQRPGPEGAAWQTVKPYLGAAR